MRRIALNENEVEMDGVAQRSGVGNKIVPQVATAQAQSDPNPKSNKRFEVIFKQMMAKIDELIAELTEKIKIQAAIATRDPNVQGDLQTTMQRYGQKLARTQPTQPQSQSRTIGVESALPRLQYTLKGVIRNLWERKILEENKSLEAYLSTKYEIDEQINSLPILAENMVSIDASAKELVGEFREKLKAILLGYFGKIASGVAQVRQSPTPQSGIKAEFEALSKNFIASYNRVTKLLESLADSEVTKFIKQKQQEMQDLRDKFEKMQKEYDELGEDQSEKIKELAEALKLNAEYVKKIETEISQYTGAKKAVKKSVVKDDASKKLEEASNEWWEKHLPTKDFTTILTCKNAPEILKNQTDQHQAISDIMHANKKEREEMNSIFDEDGEYITNVEEAMKFMDKYGIDPKDVNQVRSVWPFHRDDVGYLTAATPKTENYSEYLAKKILEGSNLEAKKRYYKYLLENGM